MKHSRFTMMDGGDPLPRVADNVDAALCEIGLTERDRTNTYLNLLAHMVVTCGYDIERTIANLRKCYEIMAEVE
jgi:hypothetical protein